MGCRRIRYPPLSLPFSYSIVFNLYMKNNDSKQNTKTVKLNGRRYSVPQTSFDLGPLRYSLLPSPSPSVNFFFRNFSTNESPVTQGSELTRVATLVDGCDYEHWIVVMEPPDGYPQRDEIIRRYIETLAMALGSEEEAKKSIYSVSTKYYYAFSCEMPESMTHMIKSLPNVRWVLPDSYLYPGENEYGGEPFVDGEVVPYDEKYHLDWLRVHDDDKGRTKTRSRKAKRKEKKF